MNNLLPYLKTGRPKKLTCACCGKEFIRYDSELNYRCGKAILCSYNCRSKYRKKIESEEAARRWKNES